MRSRLRVRENPRRAADLRISRSSSRASVEPSSALPCAGMSSSSSSGFHPPRLSTLSHLSPRLPPLASCALFSVQAPTLQPSSWRGESGSDHIHSVQGRCCAKWRCGVGRGRGQS
ncbi:hypothetical protein K437DRAFT_1553 [Tilletiaria anomala UBC 951]|uniref:Uncharacterized protein n=1 Tax=Tilletiaria anomala (strain ATCC 24038 / CBS 436.72 / UBC 951) TaxID=1037660 RepID=A0A066WS88_TILAU|nr:uncharacterized protein K437DRAFT_1553 [Tilletiaria anomala UBC 951]KDN53555.1 hypothetical protein K437DRAFT_1553 [Tilletiaria anomala UBC 951]